MDPDHGFAARCLFRAAAASTLATQGDRTIFFDFLPLHVKQVRGLGVRFQLYTVPGQTYYAATRELVLNETPQGGLLLTYVEVNGVEVRRRTRRIDERGARQPVGDDTRLEDSAVIASLSTTVLGDRVVTAWLRQVSPTVTLSEAVRAAVARRGWDIARSGLRGPLVRAPMTGCHIDTRPPAEGSALSATGCYLSTSAHTLPAFAVPYDVNATLWADGLRKRRFIMLPTGARAAVPGGPYGPLFVPEGTVFLKEFWMGQPLAGGSVLVETRLYTSVSAGVWRGYTYRWNTAMTDATLVPDRAETISLPTRPDLGFTAGRTWTLPARTGRDGCTRCHDPANGWVLGPSLRNLKRIVNYPGGPDDQLWALKQADIVNDVSLDPDAVVAQVDPYDRAARAEARALSYFEANCVHCHGQGGERADLVFGPPDVGRAALLAGLCTKIKPFDFAQVSLLWQLDQGEDRQGRRMPPLGTKVTDPLNAEVLRAWIERDSASCQP
jgi:hypothetical protein